MSKRKYQLWWTTDRGERLQRLDDFSFLNYSRVVNGVGTLNIGLPYKKYGDIYRKDYRVEVWRTPQLGKKRRLENIFYMQDGTIRTRKEDDVTVLDMSGHDPNGLLDRRIVRFKATSPQSEKTDFIDDMMKEIMTENFGTQTGRQAARSIPFDEGFFRIQADSSLGAETSKSFAFRNVLDILKELHQTSKTDTPRIYFEMVHVTPTIIEFQTFQNQRGADRRFSAGKSSFVFSLERGNLEAPNYERDSFEEKNFVYVGGPKQDLKRRLRTRRDLALEELTLWGRREMFRDSRQTKGKAAQQAVGDAELALHTPKERFVANFLDAPGSVYGEDWDLGNLHTVNYAGRQFDIEIKIVYVTVRDSGEETIFGRNEFGEF
jgi:hypothetical protein